MSTFLGLLLIAFAAAGTFVTIKGVNEEPAAIWLATMVFGLMLALGLMGVFILFYGIAP